MSVGSARVEIDCTFDLYMVLSEGTEFYRTGDPERQRQPCTDRSGQRGQVLLSSRGHMTRTRAKVLWVAIFLVTMVMGVPWFLWRSSRLFMGIPVWVWYHIGWLLFLVFLFWLFVRTYWTRAKGIWK